MGKHGKKVDCSMCHGTGKTVINFDGMTKEVLCAGCKGSGRQG